MITNGEDKLTQSDPYGKGLGMRSFRLGLRAYVWLRFLSSGRRSISSAGECFRNSTPVFLCCLGLITLEDYSQQYGRKYEDNAHHCEESC